MALQLRAYRNPALHHHTRPPWLHTWCLARIPVVMPEGAQAHQHVRGRIALEPDVGGGVGRDLHGGVDAGQGRRDGALRMRRGTTLSGAATRGLGFRSKPQSVTTSCSKRLPWCDQVVQCMHNRHVCPARPHTCMTCVLEHAHHCRRGAAERTVDLRDRMARLMGLLPCFAVMMSAVDWRSWASSSALRMTPNRPSSASSAVDSSDIGSACKEAQVRVAMRSAIGTTKDLE